MGLFSFDKQFYQMGFSIFAGVDEAGRGPWAGPVVAAAVILPENVTLTNLDDSKKVIPKKREELFEKINDCALSVGVCSAGNEEIDKLNIYNASVLAMKRAILSLSVKPEIVLVDGIIKIPELDIKQLAFVGGDGKSASIAAASIIAKVTRDRIMREFAKEYPQYGFENHMGYGTKEHQEALSRFGPCPIHRKSFGPIKVLLGQDNA